MKKSFLFALIMLFMAGGSAGLLWAQEDEGSGVAETVNESANEAEVAEDSFEFLERLKPVRTQEGKNALRIECDVPKAEIYLNGIYQGRTNLTIQNVFPGEYELTICKSGFSRVSYLIEVKRNYLLTYRVKLK